MLRIEKVFIQGFKSFNDPSELIFDPDGITAVVGPNGCGKSNVADALSWVIGEQRAKALRGGKMEDVIFQGSRNRKPSGMAEVVLTMRVYESFELRANEKDLAATDQTDSTPIPDSIAVNSSEAAPSSLNASPTSSTLPTKDHKRSPRLFQEGDRITVARRLYRTGESEYEMNGRTCRLRDIQDLFAGTGLGGAHYAIIEQGRIGQVLSAKPLDRRALIEEAAGISKFKMRQRSAELKLEAAKQNLSRVTDIINEVERQQNSLKRQAAKSRRYQRLRHEMRELMRAILMADYQATENRIEELEAERVRINTDEADLKQATAATDEERQLQHAQSAQLDQALTTAREVSANTNLQLEKARQQQQYLTEQIKTIESRSTQVIQDQATIRERERFTQNEISRLKEELIQLESGINVEAKDLAQAESLFLHQSAEDDKIEKELEVAQRRFTEAATQRERWRQLVRQFADAVERATRTQTGLQAEYQRAQDHAANTDHERANIEQKLQSLLTEQEEIAGYYQEIRHSIQSTTTSAEEAENAIKLIQQQFTATEQRLKSLCELDERRAYFSEPVQALVKASGKEHKDIKFNIVGTLADFIKVKSQYEKIVELGLKDELQYLITPSFDDALQAIEFLKRNNLGRATFLILNSKDTVRDASMPENQASIIRLIDLLGMKPEIRSVIQQALPRLSHTVIAQEIQQAITESIKANGKGSSFLTPSGELVSAGHVITGGGSLEQGSGILALKREIEDLTARYATQEETRRELLERHDEIKRQLQILQSKRTATESELREIEKNIVVTQGAKQQLDREKERASAHLRVVEKEIEIAQTELIECHHKSQHAENELRLAEEEFLTTEQIASAAQNQVVEIRRNASLRTQELSRRRADFAAKSERRKGLTQDINRLQNEGQEIANRLARAQMEATEADERARQLADSVLKVTLEIEQLELLLQTQNADLEMILAQNAQCKGSLQIIESKLGTMRESLIVLRDQRSEIEITKAKLTANLEYLEKDCATELGVAIQDLFKVETDPISTDVNEPIEALDEEDESEAESGAPIPNPSGAFDLEDAKERLNDLRRKVEAIGPVNLLALDELKELDERYKFLIIQKADIEQAVNDTVSVIAELKRRSRDRFVDAFHQINRNFTEMFLELFGGGHGEMRLIDETDVLESGIDIIAQPPGKRLQNVLLLSGGEKAMAALSLIMGIFKYRPSPFCLLDEVDAPLDDVNIGRFSDKILEMSGQTQFLVITHSKRTMEAAKTMYGVTMEDPGVSKLISVRLT